MLFADHYIADVICMLKHRAVRRNGSGLIGLSGAVGESKNGYVWAKHRSVRANVGVPFSALCRSAILASAGIGERIVRFCVFHREQYGQDRSKSSHIISKYARIIHIFANNVP